MNSKILALTLLMFNYPSLGQTRINITFNLGYGVLPTATPLDQGKEVLSEEDARKAFNFIKDDLGLEFRYSYGGCEDRAHAISIFLKKMGIAHRKIWNFNPYRINLFSISEMLSAPDKSGMNEMVSWGYHVAPIIFVKTRKNKIDTLVVDPALSSDMIHYRKWLLIQNARTANYTFLDPEFLIFNSIDGQTYSCKVNDTTKIDTIPKCFTPIITGDFRKYEGSDKTELRVEEGLVINEMAMKMIDESKASGIYEKVKPILSDIFLLTNALSMGTLPDSFSEHSQFFNKYSSQFQSRKEYWNKRLEAKSSSNP